MSQYLLPKVEELRGSADGPVLALLGGVHGDELEGPLAIRRIVAELEQSDFVGTVRWVAPAHPSAWNAGVRESPIDGQNLARVFPGVIDGTATERIAAFLTANVIRGADLLIDLHSAGDTFDMPLLAGYVADPAYLSDRSRACAEAFAAPITWIHPEASEGRSLSAAASLGVPSIYVEGRGGGQIRKEDLDQYVAGVRRVMAHLGMLKLSATELADRPQSIQVSGDGNTDGGLSCTHSGFCVTAVRVGERVVKGQLLGEIWSETGQLLSELRSPYDGVVMLLKRRSRVVQGDGIAIVAEVTE